MDIAAYIERIGYRGKLDATLNTLRGLHVAHMMSAPFENLDIHLGREIVLEESLLFDKVVRRRRGGFCYELNGLFAALLRALGFRVDMLSAGVAREAGGFSPEFDHMALAVEIVDDLWLADVGFGEGFLEPVKVAEGGEAEYHLTRDGDYWLLLRGAKPQYRFTLTARDFADYVERCRYHQTSPESSFTQGRLATLATPEGRITLTDRHLVVTRAGLREEQKIGDEQEFRLVCAERLGLVLA